MKINTDVNGLIFIRRIVMQSIPYYAFTNICTDINTSLLDNDHIESRVRNTPVFGMFDMDRLTDFVKNNPVLVNDHDYIMCAKDSNTKTKTGNATSASYSFRGPVDELRMECDVAHAGDDVLYGVTTDDCLFYKNNVPCDNPYAGSAFKFVDLYAGQSLRFTATTSLGLAISSAVYAIAATPVCVPSPRAHAQCIQITPRDPSIPESAVLALAILIANSKLTGLVARLRSAEAENERAKWSGTIRFNNDTFTMPLFITHRLMQKFRDRLHLATHSVESLQKRDGFVEYSVKEAERRPSEGGIADLVETVHKAENILLCKYI